MHKAFLALLVLILHGTALAEIRVAGALTHRVRTAPGELYKGTLTLSNSSAAPAKATVRITDYRFEADGTNHYDPPGTLPRSNANWIMLDKQEVILPANSSINVHYTLQVPAGTSGTYWSAIQVTPELPAATEGGMNVRNRIGYLVQIVSDQPGGELRVRFANPQLLRDPEGKFGFSVDTHGEGDRWMIRKVTLEAYDQSGKLAATVTSRKRRLYPGTSLRDTFPLDLQPGSYTLMVVADDDERAFGARYQIEVK